MANAIILHGMPSKEEYFNPESASQSNKHWLPWVQRQLILKGILAQTPELPEPYEPIYEKWLEVFGQFRVDENTILVGHSGGAGFLVRWLTENNIRVGKVALVAPFLDPNHDEVKSGFFNFEIDKITDKAADVCIFYSTDDDQAILDSVNQLKATNPTIKIRQFTDKGHFTFNNMQTEQFPELAEFLIEK